MPAAAPINFDAATPPPVRAFLSMIEVNRRSRRTPPNRRLHGVVVEAMAMDGVGLVARVTAMPAGFFNARHLLAPDEPTWSLLNRFTPLLSPEGEAAWNALFTLGRAAVAETLDRERDVFALILSPGVITRARADLCREAA